MHNSFFIFRELTSAPIRRGEAHHNARSGVSRRRTNATLAAFAVNEMPARTAFFDGLKLRKARPWETPLRKNCSIAHHTTHRKCVVRYNENCRTFAVCFTLLPLSPCSYDFE